MSSAELIEGWLEIEGLRCAGRHGAYPGERRRARRFLVDVALRTDLADAVRTDDLAQTTDLAAIAAVTREVVGGTPRTLLERLAADVARTLLDRFGAREVRVRVTKPRPPGLGAASEAAEVSLARGRRRAAPRPSARRAPRAGRRARG